MDPYFIVSDYPMESKIIGTAREVNNYKSFWCAEKIQNEKLQFELKHGRKPKTALMGLAFKPNIDDLRESPAKYIAQKVLQNSNNEEHYIVEPNIESHSVYKLTDYKEAIDKADIIVFLVAHREFIRIESFWRKNNIRLLWSKKIDVMLEKKNILITGGAGFIGSHVVRTFVNKYPDYNIFNLDSLTYAGNLENLKDIQNKNNYTF